MGCSHSCGHSQWLSIVPTKRRFMSWGGGGGKRESGRGRGTRVFPWLSLLTSQVKLSLPPEILPAKNCPSLIATRFASRTLVVCTVRKSGRTPKSLMECLPTPQFSVILSRPAIYKGLDWHFTLLQFTVAFTDFLSAVLTLDPINDARRQSIATANGDEWIWRYYVYLFNGSANKKLFTTMLLFSAKS